MDFREYPFDVTRLWEPLEPHEDIRPAQTLTTRPKRRLPAAEVLQFPQRGELAKDADSMSCRKRTRAELRSIAMSLRGRDAMRRNWIAARCGACRRCPDMLD